jgi:hypothetical protein
MAKLTLALSIIAIGLSAAALVVKLNERDVRRAHLLHPQRQCGR